MAIQPSSNQKSYSNVAGRQLHKELAVTGKLNLQQLRAKLEETKAERIRSLFLSGKHNPFLTSNKFIKQLIPFMLHINLNYLVLPDFFLTDFTPKAIRRFYEFPTSRLEENRAMPIRFPEVASFPFDPTTSLKSADRNELNAIYDDNRVT